MSKIQRSRRRFLTGAAGIALGLPWLESLEKQARAQTAATGPRRVIVMTYAMGVPLGAWRPTGTGPAMVLPFVTEPLQPFSDRCLFVSSIDNRVLEAGGDPFVWGHPAKKEAALTGTLTTGAFNATNSNQASEVRAGGVTTGGANSASVEHLIGSYLRSTEPLASVDLGVDGSARLRESPATQASEFFFEGPGNPISLALNPGAAFDSLLAPLQMNEGPPSDAELALARVRARNKSVLDAVRDSFADLSKGLGAEDRLRLEEHASRIRRLELDVALSTSCSIPAGITPGGIQGMNMAEIAPLQNRILAHAMGCGLAPVGRIEYVNQQNPRFGITALDAALDAAGDTYDWHAMVHGDPLPGTSAFLRPGRGAESEYNSLLLSGYRFFVEQFAALLAELDAIPEGPESSVLDNSLVVLASDLGEGLGHGHMKMGYVLAGNLGGATPGTHFDGGPDRAFEAGGAYYYAESRYTVSQLLNSITDMAGVVDDAGEPLEVGLQGFIAEQDAPRRIDALFG